MECDSSLTPDASDDEKPEIGEDKNAASKVPGEAASSVESTGRKVRRNMVASIRSNNALVLASLFITIDLLGGCLKKHVEGDGHAMAEQSAN